MDDGSFSVWRSRAEKEMKLSLRISVYFWLNLVLILWDYCDVMSITGSIPLQDSKKVTGNVKKY